MEKTKVCVCVFPGKIYLKETLLKTDSKAHIVSTLTDIIMVWDLERGCYGVGCKTPLHTWPENWRIYLFRWANIRELELEAVRLVREENIGISPCSYCTPRTVWLPQSNSVLKMWWARMSHIIPGSLDPVPLTLWSVLRKLRFCLWREAQHRDLGPLPTAGCIHVLCFIARSLKGSGLGLQPLVTTNIKIGIHIE